MEDAAAGPVSCVQDDRMAEETAKEAARPKKRLRTAEGRVQERKPRPMRQLESKSGLDLSKLHVADGEWLRNHPLYFKMHQRNYPIPIGDQDILALKAFTPKEMGGDACLEFHWDSWSHASNKIRGATSL